ncbi:MAG: HD-GYP domain-containing protein [Gammaproteobacteria bacterium]|nr:HD-GYP domain-containing protein [Gammaproteobacteria bacterium]
MLVKTKISVLALEVGMSVVELDRPWTDLPFALQGLTIKDDFEIQILQKYCKYVFIEHDYSGSLALNKDQALPEFKPSLDGKKAFTRKIRGLQPKTELDNELARAHSVYFQARRHMEHIFNMAKNHRKIDVKETQSIVTKCITSIVSNANALFWLTRIQDSSAIEANHSLRVAVLSIALGHYVGLNRQELEQLGIAALLHDIGKTRIPDEILTKRARFTEAEKRVMERHTALGYELLHADTSLEPIIKEVALNHHQRPDGQGYPAKQRNHPLSLFTRIVSIVDSYDDMTHEISHLKSRSPRLALKEIYEKAGKQFDPNLAKAFIKMVGIYPAGSMVKMTNGEVAMVVSTDTESKLSPKVELIYNQYGKMRSPLIVDLQEGAKDQAGQPYKIAGSLPDGSLGMDMKRYIADRLNISAF